ncbi:unnamed protein product [Owenia fusiformis]|uniref:Uncharacterized protein n=1 Tax=Owenia fusiformis TaxID=6347 RepID=A0A8J1TV17_OWEFU|nr:unnamed protein product [Owenia fusiformis]
MAGMDLKSDQTETERLEEVFMKISLFNAISSDDPDRVDRILTSGTNPNSVYHLHNPLCVAVQENLHEIVDVLLKHNCDVNQSDLSDPMWCRPALHLACSSGFYELVQKLIKHGADINLCDQDNRTPLHWAATYGHNSVAKLLIRNGASVNIAQQDGFTPLHSAACLGLADVCSFLIQNGADVNIKDKDGWTAMLASSCYGHFNIVCLLISYGSDINVRNKDLDSAIHVTIDCGHTEIANMLIENNIKLDFVNKKNFTPLHIAVNRNNISMAKKLIELGVDVNIKQEGGHSPLYLAALVKFEEKMVRLLLMCGAQLMQEEFLVLQDPPEAMLQKSGFKEMLTMLRSQITSPSALYASCCYSVRKTLGKNYSEKVKHLPIPVTTKQDIAMDYLNYEDFGYGRIKSQQ